MLVLTRKLMERIHIGDEICVTVVRIEGGQVRLGIDAPRTIPVVREEIRTGPKAKVDSASPTSPMPTSPVDGRPQPPLRMRPTAPHGTDSRPRAPSR